MATITPDEFDTLWNFDDPAASEARFRPLLAEVEAGSSAHVQLLTQIARAQGLQRQFDAAHATLDDANSLLHENMPRAQVRYLLERGRVFNSAGRRDLALPLFHQALAAAQAAGLEFEAVDAAHMIAIAAPPDQQLPRNLEALALAERATNEKSRKWLASLYNNIAWSYHDQGDYERALTYFHKALHERERSGSARSIRIARWCVARALRSLGKIEEALHIQEALRVAHEEEKEESGYVYEELAEGNLLLGREAEARRYFSRAYHILVQDPWLVAQEPDRLKRLRTLGGVTGDIAG